MFQGKRHLDISLLITPDMSLPLVESTEDRISRLSSGSQLGATGSGPQLFCKRTGNSLIRRAQNR